MSLYAKHGQVSLSSSGSLIINTSEEAWLREAALDFIIEGARTAKPLLCKSWSKIG